MRKSWWDGNGPLWFLLAIVLFGEPLGTWLAGLLP